MIASSVDFNATCDRYNGLGCANHMYVGHERMLYIPNAIVYFRVLKTVACSTYQARYECHTNARPLGSTIDAPFKLEDIMYVQSVHRCRQ